jgi:tRNA (mo5U34)-methyltransferase
MNGPTQAEVDSIPYWLHTIEFPNGVRSRGAKSLEQQSTEIELAFRYPVAGKTVLDIGAWNGLFSVEAARRGASRVVALDHYTWVHPTLQGYKAFDIVRRHLAPAIEDVTRDVMDLKAQPVGEFDVVLFLGVLYHLRHPLYVLELLHAIVKEHLVIETHLDLLECDRPGMIFYPKSELLGDHTNWWGPNVQCVVEMLKVVGFSRIEIEYKPDYPRAFFYAFR